MQLRMVARRSLNGSMTLVGDIAQATGPLAADDWADVLAHLPQKKEPRVIGLSVGYRIPAQIMELADKVMHAARPGLRAPRSVRQGDELPRIVSASNGDLVKIVVDEISSMRERLAAGNVAVVCPDHMVSEVSDALDAVGVHHGRAHATALEAEVTVVPVSLVKGLELDGVVVVEPAAIVADEVHGLRALYVALTRSTRSLTVVHAQPLPDAMR